MRRTRWVAAGCVLLTTSLMGCTGTSARPDRTPSEVLPPAPSGAASTTATPPGPTGKAHRSSSPPAAGTSAHGHRASRSPDDEDLSRRVDQRSVLGSLPGSATAHCVRVGHRRDVRSRSVAVGNFRAARSSFAKQYGTSEAPELNLYVIPLHAGHVAGATVDVAGPRERTAHRVTSSSVQRADQWTYVAAQVPIPAPGTYRFTVTSGQDRGCFVASFTA